MSLPDQQLVLIAIKYIRGEQLTDEEMEQLKIFVSGDKKQLLSDDAVKEALQKEAQQLGNARNEIWNMIAEGMEDNKVMPMRPRVFRMRAIAAAVALLFIAGSVYIWWSNSNDKKASAKNIVSLTPEDIKPVPNTTTLTLANGKTIILDSSVQQGTLATENDGNIVRLRSGELVYQPGSISNDPSSIEYNTLSTSKGGQQRIVLSDGTIVWLNATSSIKYPVAFAGAERKVSITGEAYFEVAKSKAPFIVDIDGKGSVEVLGTHFNINSYADEDDVKVTLLEGKVRVQSAVGSSTSSERQSAILMPGQQVAFTQNSKFKIQNSPDLDQVMAWKNGSFVYRSADIVTILRDAVRWYDIDVTYNGKPKERFYGKIDRKVNLAQFLLILKENSISFKFENNRNLIIYDK